MPAITKSHYVMSHPVHLSLGSLHSSPSPANTLLSAVSKSFALPPTLSRSTQWPSSLLRIPLLSNLRFFTFFTYRLRSRWKVAPDVQPATAQPAVFQGLIIISTRL